MSLNKPIWKLKKYDLLDPLELIKKYPEMINWDKLSKKEYKNEMRLDYYTPSIYELDYEKMKENNQEMYEELIKEVMKPSRVFKNPDYDYLEELFGE
jgi:hypothetical protein